MNNKEIIGRSREFNGKFSKLSVVRCPVYSILNDYTKKMYYKIIGGRHE